MSTHPINLALRFLLELSALVSLGYWGWTRHEGALRIVLVIALPLAAAAVWGVFTTPGDRTRSPEAVVPTPGIIRLVIEALLFAGAVFALFAAGQRIPGWIFAGIVVLHYGISYERIAWLMKQ
jgi:hypothetical protein